MSFSSVLPVATPLSFSPAPNSSGMISKAPHSSIDRELNIFPSPLFLARKNVLNY